MFLSHPWRDLPSLAMSGAAPPPDGAPAAAAPKSRAERLSHFMRVNEIKMEHICPLSHHHELVDVPTAVKLKLKDPPQDAAEEEDVGDAGTVSAEPSIDAFALYNRPKECKVSEWRAYDYAAENFAGQWTANPGAPNLFKLEASVVNAYLNGGLYHQIKNNRRPSEMRADVRVRQHLLFDVTRIAHQASQNWTIGIETQAHLDGEAVDAANEYIQHLVGCDPLLDYLDFNKNHVRPANQPTVSCSLPRPIASSRERASSFIQSFSQSIAQTLRCRFSASPLPKLSGFDSLRPRAPARWQGLQLLLPQAASRLREAGRRDYELPFTAKDPTGA